MYTKIVYYVHKSYQKQKITYSIKLKSYFSSGFYEINSKYLSNPTDDQRILKIWIWAKWKIFKMVFLKGGYLKTFFQNHGFEGGYPYGGILSGME